MSKLRRSIFFTFAVCGVILQLFYNSYSQKTEINLKIKQISPPIIQIEGEFSEENKSKNWTFLNSIAGNENLGERISDFTLIDKNGKNVLFKKLMAGEYLAEDFAQKFAYKIDLSRKEKVSSMAHISWIFGETGLLMTDDLLPQFGQKSSVKIHFDLPKDWKISGGGNLLEDNSFFVADIEKAVFIIGKNWRERKNDKVNLAFSGDWQFTDDEALNAANEVLREYKNIFGEIPNEKTQIFMVRFPESIQTGNWEAETRGANVVILSSDMPFKNQSLQRLHEQFRHELFHLWIPNNLSLTGNYDWFYEGFALYQSLRTGIELNGLRFEDFLDTLSRAYNLDNFQSQKISLIEASKNRWSGANSQIYARGMLVAFLCDIAILNESKGKRSLTEIFREIYRKYRKPNTLHDGNSAILSLFESRRELRQIVEKYIKGAESIEWNTDLEAVGIEAKIENSFTKLSVKSKLNGRQKDLLNELGYNNWRKIVSKTK